MSKTKCEGEKKNQTLSRATFKAIIRSVVAVVAKAIVANYILLFANY